jgi:hypothetical protein
MRTKSISKTYRSKLKRREEHSSAITVARLPASRNWDGSVRKLATPAPGQTDGQHRVAYIIVLTCGCGEIALRLAGVLLVSDKPRVKMSDAISSR